MLTRRWLDHERGGYALLAVVGVLALVVPIANLLIPAGSPLHLSTFMVTLLGKYLCYALLAIALDLVWGYVGILSLGHGAGPRGLGQTGRSVAHRRRWPRPLPCARSARHAPHPV
jgi:hypothetical protein